MTTPDHDAASPAPTLPELRDRIDALDRELIAMLNRRARLAQEVGEIKKREGSVVFRPEREAQVIDGLKQFNPGPLKNESVAPIWREIMSATLTMRDFSDNFLDAYLALEGEEMLGSVGCYRLEGPGAQLFSKIEGDYFAILGLPLMGLLDLFRRHGVLTP